MTRKPKTARQVAESQIREELSKCDDRCFISFGTYVSNDVMLKIVQAALKEQREASKPAHITSSWTKAIRFKYEDEYYYVDRNAGVSTVHLFNGGAIGKEVLFSEKAAPEVCMKDFMTYMDNLSKQLDNIN